MANCGERIERYETLANGVPFYRLASWVESKLKEAEEAEQRHEEAMRNARKH